MSRRTAAALAIAALALASAMVVQGSGPNQAAHFALVRSLADGTAEVRPRESVDVAYIDGRYYAAKAPGLALFTLPWYGAVSAAGLQDGSLADERTYTHRLWWLDLFGALLPVLAVVALATVAVERLVPGLGLPTSILLGAGTLLFPFSTLFFDHALSAMLGFAAFVVLLLDRLRGGGKLWTPAAAGCLAGLAIVAEFPLGIVAIVLGAYALADAPRLRRGIAYAAGVLAGLVPLVAFNTWAFGSPTTIGYARALERPLGPGGPVVGANDEGFYGVELPDLRVALTLLVSEKGLLVVTPLALAGVVGLVLLWRAGRRAETGVCVGVLVLFLLFNAAYYLPFGGGTPGPRFLVPALPFLALPLAYALRAWPLPVAGLALGSAAVMALATTTSPLTPVEYGIDEWISRLVHGEVVETVPAWLDLVSGVWSIVPVLGALAAACALAVRRVLLGAWRDDWALLAGAVGGWLVLTVSGPALAPVDARHGTPEGTAGAIVLVALLCAGVVLARRLGAMALVPLVPAALLALPQVTDRPRLALFALGLVSVLASAAWTRLAAQTRVRELDPSGRKAPLASR
jgi:hypothetical protein